MELQPAESVPAVVLGCVYPLLITHPAPFTEPGEKVETPLI